MAQNGCDDSDIWNSETDTSYASLDVRLQSIDVHQVQDFGDANVGDGADKWFELQRLRQPQPQPVEEEQATVRRVPVNSLIPQKLLSKAHSTAMFNRQASTHSLTSSTTSSTSASSNSTAKSSGACRPEPRYFAGLGESLRNRHKVKGLTPSVSSNTGTELQTRDEVHQRQQLLNAVVENNADLDYDAQECELTFVEENTPLAVVEHNSRMTMTIKSRLSTTASAISTVAIEGVRSQRISDQTAVNCVASGSGVQAVQSAATSFDSPKTMNDAPQRTSESIALQNGNLANGDAGHSFANELNIVPGSKTSAPTGNSAKLPSVPAVSLVISQRRGLESKKNPRTIRINGEELTRTALDRRRLAGKPSRYVIQPGMQNGSCSGTQLGVSISEDQNRRRSATNNNNNEALLAAQATTLHQGRFAVAEAVAMTSENAAKAAVAAAYQDDDDCVVPSGANLADATLVNKSERHAAPKLQSVASVSGCHSSYVLPPASSSLARNKSSSRVRSRTSRGLSQNDRRDSSGTVIQRPDHVGEARVAGRILSTHATNNNRLPGNSRRHPPPPAVNQAIRRSVSHNIAARGGPSVVGGRVERANKFFDRQKYWAENRKNVLAQVEHKEIRGARPQPSISRKRHAERGAQPEAARPIRQLPTAPVVNGVLKSVSAASSSNDMMQQQQRVRCRTTGSTTDDSVPPSSSDDAIYWRNKRWQEQRDDHLRRQRDMANLHQNENAAARPRIVARRRGGTFGLHEAPQAEQRQNQVAAFGRAIANGPDRAASRGARLVTINALSKPEGATVPNPFNFAAHVRTRQEHDNDSDELPRRDAVLFRANPMPDFSRLFIADKPKAHATVVMPFKFATDVRLEERHLFDKHVHDLEVEKLEQVRRAERLLAEREQQVRRLMVHKPLPVPVYKPIQVLKSTKPLTEAHSPKFLIEERLRARRMPKPHSEDAATLEAPESRTRALRLPSAVKSRSNSAYNAARNYAARTSSARRSQSVIGNILLVPNINIIQPTPEQRLNNSSMQRFERSFSAADISALPAGGLQRVDGTVQAATACSSNNNSISSVNLMDADPIELAQMLATNSCENESACS